MRKVDRPTTLCDDCDQPAEFIERIDPYCADMPRYKCAKHKPVEKPGKITFGIYMGNKIR